MINTEIMKAVRLTEDERSVLNYLCRDPLFVPEKEERMAVALRKRDRKKLFLNATAKVFEVLETKRAE
ncbi:hypothetical protein KJ841_00515 [Patescibacteria group bacterium]|nr:hypothetical protein [Patescibacteria group bacterium]